MEQLNDKQLPPKLNSPQKSSISNQHSIVCTLTKQAKKPTKLVILQSHEQENSQLQNIEFKTQKDLIKGRPKKLYDDKKQKKNDKQKSKILLKSPSNSVQEVQKMKQITIDPSQVMINAEEESLMSEKSNFGGSPLKKSIKQQSIRKSKRKSKNSYLYKYDRQQQQSEIEAYRFPFNNEYIQKHSQQFISTQQAIEKAKIELKQSDYSPASQKQGTFLNCDVRYFNWEHFIQQVGKFDVLIIDPPWRIKGAQQNDSQFMFSNCKFSLQYNTMGNSQIARIPLHLISDQGFIFLWILNSQMDSSIEIMQTWGYQLVDEITWVKLRDNKIYLTHGYYFMHSYEICLIGYKNTKKSSQNRLTIRGPLSNNTLFAQVKKKSQKPSDLYVIIQMMFSGKKCIQVFARNNNLRFGVFSIGNELGQSYEKWNLHLNCDKCQHPIAFGTKRYKSIHRANFDLCFKCIELQKKEQFFQISNNVDEDIRHQYVSCNHCGVQPIWGLRFQCVTCQDYDICQNCYDKNLQLTDKFHPIEHEYRILQFPVFGNGFPIHQVKCFACYQNPIIGVYFNCTFCKNYKLCQKCYFQRPKTDNNSRNHKADHQMEVLFEPQIDVNKKYECFACKVQILEKCHMCQNCYNFFFCNECFQKRESFKSLYANSHKKYHIFTEIF